MALVMCAEIQDFGLSDLCTKLEPWTWQCLLRFETSGLAMGAEDFSSLWLSYLAGCVMSFALAGSAFISHKNCFIITDINRF